MWISVAIFLITYVFIIWEKFDRAIVSLIGAFFMILLKIIDQKSAFAGVDFNTLGLLIGMMILVMVTKRSGIFEYIAIKLVKIAKANPIRILILLSLATGVMSALLDNVTTILLIIPVTINIVKDLKIKSPVPFIITEVFASNVGGTGTLIGDPPNIIIGSAVGFTFKDFLINNGLFVLIVLVVVVLMYAVKYREEISTEEKLKQDIMKRDEKRLIKDRRLLKKSLCVLALVLLGFLFHGELGYESATIAMFGGILLLMISGLNVEEIFKEIEWNTIFFFIGLFILVGGLKSTGAIDLLAEYVLKITKGNLVLTAVSVLWVSAIASAFIDNIPFVTTMIPLIFHIGQVSGMNINPLWWALSLGACLGGNGTIVGASANVIASGMSKKMGNKEITFKDFFIEAFPMMIFTVFLATIYIWVAYLRIT